MKLFAVFATVVVVCVSSVTAADRPFAGSSPVDPKHLYLGSLEHQFGEIEAEAPGFAGWYLDNSGNAVVLVKENGRRDEAMARVRRILDERPAGRHPAGVKASIAMRPAIYSFSELAGFRHLFTRNFPEGVVSVDVDEVNNTLAVGVRDADAVRTVRAAAARLKIPGAALRIEVAERPQSRASLWDHQRPIRGGLGFTSSAGDCTVGINAKAGSSSTMAGFYSAAHCSQDAWTWDGAYVYQPNIHSSNFIGYEWDDPTPVTGVPGCPVPAGNNSYDPDLGCRHSDAAFFLYDAANRSTLNGGATIAQTSWWAYGGRGSTTVNGSMPILGEVWAPPTGEWIDKIGTTSGWTYGMITDTCLLELSDQTTTTGDPVYLICQDKTSIWSEPGDSGAAVFKWTENGVYWVGILWASNNSYTRSWHSRNDGVWLDFPTYTYYW